MVANRLGGVILAGGSGERLGGSDKPMLEVGGEPLLMRAVRAFGRSPVVLTGTPRQGFERYEWVCEDPPGTGPTAALAAGLAALEATSDCVGLLAADLVGVNAATMLRLSQALRSVDGAVLSDSTGQPQWVISMWRVAALRAVLPADPSGVPLRGVLGKLRIAEVPELPGESADVDTPMDLARARARHGDRDGSSQCSYRLWD